ncbi:Thiol:disulfide interchange protein (Protein-disulfide reductase) [Cupriavidus sp. HMR-1]|uniref:protein-disulfide reductase DsbD n=1 Tax=Cupriavidus sp. HMR-1 TaxID=1249621 RepID=UPI0002A402B4|nr:protein-disulfide reductase DsbD [Cupriavidus sp. HMR-1]ELA00260.1 Thiol:disulfide interchange protein (Protein-disulfide reductase) [Cupriavidus sp. HMR-1]
MAMTGSSIGTMWKTGATRGNLVRHFAALWLTVFACLFFWTVAHAATEDDFLPPEQAFRFVARQIDQKTVEVRFDVADGYYLYRERFSFAAQPADVKLGKPEMPAGKVHFDETFGKDMETYRGAVVIKVPVEQAPADGRWSLVVTSQGCADKGLCYPPMESIYKVGGSVLGNLFGDRGAAAQSTPEAQAPAAVQSAPDSATPTRQSKLVDDTDRIANALASRNLALIGALFFGLGILLTFTPCVLPMVPILSSIVVGEHVTRGRAFLVSLSYVLGMAVVYTTVGVAAGLAGEGLAAALQTPWVLGAFAALMVALAMSMFGMYELQMPQRWQARLTESSNRRQSGQFVGAALMGAISALIVGPCVTAPLAGALAYIAQTGDAITGGGALMAMALGMGVPLMLVGMGAGNLLPRAGKWMEATKRFFGFLLLGVAIWMVTPVLPAWVVMLAWAALLLVAAVYLGAFDALGPDPRGLMRLGKGLGLLAALVGAIQIVGVASGGRNPLQPLSHLSLSAATLPPHAAETRFERVRSIAELDARIAQASAAGRPVLLDFYADWCVSCKEMEKLTFPDAKVRAQLADVVLLQADVTANNADDRALLKRFGLFGPPGIILFGKDGQERPVRVIGYQSASRFLESLERALGPRSQT